MLRSAFRVRMQLRTRNAERAHDNNGPKQCVKYYGIIVTTWLKSYASRCDILCAPNFEVIRPWKQLHISASQNTKKLLSTVPGSTISDLRAVWYSDELFLCPHSSIIHAPSLTSRCIKHRIIHKEPRTVVKIVYAAAATLLEQHHLARQIFGTAKNVL